MAINLYDSYPICTISIPSGVVRAQRLRWKLGDSGHGIYIEMRDSNNNFIPFINEGIKLHVVDAGDEKHIMNGMYFRNGVKVDIPDYIVSISGDVLLQIQLTDINGVKMHSETFKAEVVSIDGEKQILL